MHCEGTRWLHAARSWTKNTMLRAEQVVCCFGDSTSLPVLAVDSLCPFAALSLATNFPQGFGLNIFYSGRTYTEKDWVRFKVRHYPLLGCLLVWWGTLPWTKSCPRRFVQGCCPWEGGYSPVTMLLMICFLLDVVSYGLSLTCLGHSYQNKTLFD